MTPVKDVSVITCWLSVDSVQFSSSSAVVPVAAFTIGFGETAASFSLLKINAELTQPATTQDRGGSVHLRLIQSSPDTILVSRRGLPCNGSTLDINADNDATSPFKRHAFFHSCVCKSPKSRKQKIVLNIIVSKSRRIQCLHYWVGWEVQTHGENPSTRRKYVDFSCTYFTGRQCLI